MMRAAMASVKLAMSIVVLAVSNIVLSAAYLVLAASNIVLAMSNLVLAASNVVLIASKIILLAAVILFMVGALALIIGFTIFVIALVLAAVILVVATILFITALITMALLLAAALVVLAVVAALILVVGMILLLSIMLIGGALILAGAIIVAATLAALAVLTGGLLMIAAVLLAGGLLAVAGLFVAVSVVLVAVMFAAASALFLASIAVISGLILVLAAAILAGVGGLCVLILYGIGLALFRGIGLMWTITMAAVASATIPIMAALALLTTSVALLVFTIFMGLPIVIYLGYRALIDRFVAALKESGMWNWWAVEVKREGGLGAWFINNMQESWPWMKDFWGYVRDWLLESFHLTGLYTWWVDDVQGAGGLWGYFSYWMQKTFKGFSDAGQKLMDTVCGWFSSTWAWLSDLFGSVKAALVRWFGDSWIGKLFFWVCEKWDKLVEAAADGIVDLATGGQYSRDKRELEAWNSYREGVHNAYTQAGQRLSKMTEEEILTEMHWHEDRYWSHGRRAAELRAAGNSEAAQTHDGFQRDIGRLLLINRAMYVHAVWKSQFLDLKRLDGLINSATSFGSKYQDLTVVNSNTTALRDDQTKLNEMWGRIFKSRTTVPFLYFNEYAHGSMHVKAEINFKKMIANMGISYDPSFRTYERGPGLGLVWGDGPDALKGYIALLKEALAKMLEDYNKTKKAM